MGEGKSGGKRQQPGSLVNGAQAPSGTAAAATYQQVAMTLGNWYDFSEPQIPCL